jgi:hypothetical protein
MIRKTALFSISIVSVAACAVEPAESEYAFGLTADELLAAKHVTSVAVTDAEWLELHHGDFTCARHGELCGAIGPDGASGVIELGYRMAIDGASVDEIERAQDAAFDDAREAWVESEPSVFTLAGNTEPYFFEGVTNKRLLVTAWAIQLWPSGNLRAKGECRTQKNVLGWNPFNTDICGSMTATYTESSGGIIRFSNTSCVTNNNSLALAPYTRAAAALQTDVFCTADKESLHAEGFSVEINDP